MVQFTVESELLPLPAHCYFVEKDTPPFRALLAKALRLGKMECLESWTDGDITYVKLVTQPEIGDWVPNSLRNRLEDLEYCDTIAYDPKLLRGSPYITPITSTPSIFSDKVTIKTELQVVAVGEGQCKQVLSGEVSVRVFAVGRMLESVIVDSVRKTYEVLPQVVERWCTVREEVLNQPDGAQRLLSGVPFKLPEAVAASAAQAAAAQAVAAVAAPAAMPKEAEDVAGGGGEAQAKPAAVAGRLLSARRPPPLTVPGNDHVRSLQAPFLPTPSSAATAAGGGGSRLFGGMRRAGSNKRAHAAGDLGHVLSPPKSAAVGDRRVATRKKKAGGFVQLEDEASGGEGEDGHASAFGGADAPLDGGGGGEDDYEALLTAQGHHDSWSPGIEALRLASGNNLGAGLGNGLRQQHGGGAGGFPAQGPAGGGAEQQEQQLNGGDQLRSSRELGSDIGSELFYDPAADDFEVCTCGECAACELDHGTAQAILGDRRNLLEALGQQQQQQGTSQQQQQQGTSQHQQLTTLELPTPGGARGAYASCALPVLSASSLPQPAAAAGGGDEAVGMDAVGEWDLGHHMASAEESAHLLTLQAPAGGGSASDLSPTGGSGSQGGVNRHPSHRKGGHHRRGSSLSALRNRVVSVFNTSQWQNFNQGYAHWEQVWTDLDVASVDPEQLPNPTARLLHLLALLHSWGLVRLVDPATGKPIRNVPGAEDGGGKSSGGKQQDRRQRPVGGGGEEGEARAGPGEQEEHLDVGEGEGGVKFRGRWLFRCFSCYVGQGEELRDLRQQSVASSRGRTSGSPSKASAAALRRRQSSALDAQQKEKLLLGNTRAR